MRQGDPHPESAGEVRERPDEVFLGETETGEDTFGFVLRVLPAMGGVQRSERGDGIAEMFFEILREIADPQARALADAPAVHRLLAQNQTEQCRLTDAVGADQADAAPRAQSRRGLLEDGPGP